jgi:hypothetical protein
VFFQLLAGIEDYCDPKRNPLLVREFLLSLDNAGISIYSGEALQFLPSAAFSGAFNPGDIFVVNTGEVLGQLTESELLLARQHLLVGAEQLQGNEELTKLYGHALRRAESQKTV